MKERDGEGEGGRVDRMRGGKKKEWQCSVFAPCSFLSHGGHQARYIWGKNSSEREKREAAGSLRDWCSGQTAAQRDHG